MSKVRTSLDFLQTCVFGRLKNKHFKKLFFLITIKYLICFIYFFEL